MEKEEDKISNAIIGAAIEVHKNLGPGLLESSYEECICFELALKNIRYERQKELPIIYKKNLLNCNYRIDLLIENKVIVELKSVNKIEPIFEAQLLTYLKLSNIKLGLLINFNERLLKDGIRRIVNNL